MDNKEYKKLVKEKIVTLLNLIIAKQTHPIEGIRSILQLRHEIGLSNEELFLPFIGIASETDEFPLGQARNFCSKELLAKYDLELNDYLILCSSKIEETCHLLKQKIESMTF